MSYCGVSEVGLPELNRVHPGDCRDFLRSLPRRSVQCVVTSPPYWNLRDYQAEGQIGLEKSWDEHLAVLLEVFREVWRVLRPDGTVWLNYGDAWAQKGKRPQPTTDDEQASNDRRAYERNHWSGAYAGRPGWARATGTADGTRWKVGDQMLLPARLAIALCDDGWWVKSENPWCKLNPSPAPDRGRPTYAHEHVYQLAKSQRPFYDIEAVRVQAATQEKRRERIVYQQRVGSKAKSVETSTFYPPHPAGRNLWSYWLIASRACPDAHTATFPEDLVEMCLKASTSEHGACADCGAPYRRVKRPTAEYQERLGASWNDHEGDLVRGQRGCPKKMNTALYETIGWERTCSCATEHRVPCLVLDPFAGSGTVGAVAERLGLRHLGSELNPEYLQLANDWIEATRSGVSIHDQRAVRTHGQGILFDQTG